MRATLAGKPANATLALVWPALDSGALDAEPDTALRIIALFTLTANDQLATATAACDTIIDAARPRGWLIALAMASHMRAMALVPAERIRAAELDARLSFDYKLAAAPIDVVLWPLHTLVNALVELNDAEAALAAAGQQGDPPTGAAGAPLLLQSRACLRLAQHRHEGRARRRAPAPNGAVRDRRAHPRRAPRRRPRRRPPQPPRDRPAALHHPAHRRNAPHPRLPEADITSRAELARGFADHDQSARDLHASPSDPRRLTSQQRLHSRPSEPGESRPDDAHFHRDDERARG